MSIALRLSFVPQGQGDSAGAFASRLSELRELWLSDVPRMVEGGTHSTEIAFRPTFGPLGKKTHNEIGFRERRVSIATFVAIGFVRWPDGRCLGTSVPQ